MDGPTMPGRNDNPQPPNEGAVAHAVGRFWEARARGRRVSVDELLETSPGSAEHDAMRASVIQAIAVQAATYSGESAPPSDADFSSSLAQALSGTGPMPTIDGYDLVACLGRGGMGAVYEGYQQSTGRRVAVKFMLDSVGASESARKRFEREVEVVARLQHPNIVSVLDSGVRRGRYFYAMDFVEGWPLDTALVPGKSDVRKAIELIAEVCDAVDYAHQRGVLHRDLKPGNIIVDDQGWPHLLDFGLAKVFDPADGDGGTHGRMGLTVSGPGQILGTVAYMSPEQALGKHDETSVRTDVYALGAIAFELLTGRLPTGGRESLHEALKRIIEEDPPAPSSLRPGLSRDLDAVLLKSLSKSPAHRYATAGEFAADLRRVLAGEPVIARRVSAAGRAWRWVQRNQAISAVTAAAVLTLIVVTTFATAKIIEESRIAARERDNAQETLDRFLKILGSVDPNQSPGGITVLQLLEIATEDLDESPMERGLAEAKYREMLGTVFRNFGQYESAFDHQEKVVDIREQQAAGGDDPHLAEALHNLAAILWWQGEYDEAEPLYRRALEMRRRLFGETHEDVASTLTHLAACRLRMGRYDEARAMYENVLAMRRRMFGDESPEVAAALNNLAKCMLEADEFDQAESLHRQAFDMIRRLTSDTHLHTAAASHNLGECLIRRSRADEIAGDEQRARQAVEGAKSAFARALEIRTTTFPDGNHFVAASMNGLARAELRLGRLGRAAGLAHDSLEMYRRERPDDHSDLVGALRTVGQVQAATGDYAGGVQALRAAVGIAENVKPPDEGQIAKLRGELGLVLAHAPERGEAEALLLDSYHELRSRRGDMALDTVLAARRLVEFYEMRGETAQAEAYRRAARMIGDGPAEVGSATSAPAAEERHRGEDGQAAGPGHVEEAAAGDFDAV